MKLGKRLARRRLWMMLSSVETTKVGIPVGQLPKAFVVRKDDSLTEAAVKEHIEKLTTRYKWLAEGKEKIPKVGSRALLSLRFCKSTVLFWKHYLTSSNYSAYLAIPTHFVKILAEND